MRTHFSKGGLRQWVAEKWVDIGAPKKDGQVSTMREKQRLKEEISKMRPTCKSHTDVKRAKGECCQTKTSSR
jgi:hypothetical protein